MTRVEAHTVKKFYQGRTVLDLDVVFETGNLYALLGPNGSGKSTLLRMLSMVERPDAGSIRYYDRERELPSGLDLSRRIVLVPDRKGLFNDTVSNNVHYGLKIRGQSKLKRLEKTEKALRAVGLWELRGANALGLSTGEAQRLCLAMALAVDPDVVLLDEPTSSLDPYNVALVENIVGAMKGANRLVVLVTHNVFQARRVADKALLLLQGKIIESGAVDMFFDHPTSELTRKFINGEMIY